MGVIVTLLTDFGDTDPFVAEMKGVILSIGPELRLHDLSHQIPKFDIEAGSRFLSSAAPFFPDGTIHIAVVDPGVGSARRRIIVRAVLRDHQGPKQALFIGPDNGLFSGVIAAADNVICREITATDLLPRYPAARTFDGRNIFAPTAALLAVGAIPESSFGAETPAVDLIRLPTLQPKSASDGTMIGQVVAFDSYGNATTNLLPPEMENSLIRVRVLSLGLVLPVSTCFSEIPPQSLGAIINSDGYIELAVNRGSAKQLYTLTQHETVELLLR